MAAVPRDLERQRPPAGCDVFFVQRIIHEFTDLYIQICGSKTLNLKAAQFWFNGVRIWGLET